MDISKVGVVGGGLMGSGIAEVCARAGLDVVVAEVGEAALAAARARRSRTYPRRRTNPATGVMAQAVLSTGRHAETHALAGEIVREQRALIGEINARPAR